MSKLFEKNEPRHYWFVMTIVHWHRFKERLPKNGSAVIVEDHEGNQSTGIWHTVHGFESIDHIPIGLILKWSPIEVVIYSTIERECRIFYENGKEVDMESLYEDAPLFKNQE